MTLKLALGLLSLVAFAQTPGPNPMTVNSPTHAGSGSHTSAAAGAQR